MPLFVIAVAATSLVMTQGFPLSPVSPGTSASLVCESGSGNPTPDITWWRNSQSVIDGDVYAITTEEIPGDFNEQGRRSILSFTATYADSNLPFECRIDDYARSSSLFINSKFHPFS